MEKVQLLSSPGYILKKERLASLSNGDEYRELILENLDPFPAFFTHDNQPMYEAEKKPRCCYLILNEERFNQEEKFIRLNTQLKQENPSIRFNAALGNLQMNNKTMACVRLLIENFDQLPQLLLQFKQAGLVLKSRKLIKPYLSLIGIRKFFELEQLSEGIYKDLDQEETYYFQVVSYVDWDTFERITVHIRKGMDHKLYDAAQAALYRKSGLLDLVRIYDKKINLEILQRLKRRYSFEMNKCSLQPLRQPG